MRCKKCGVVTRHPKYEHWLERQMCAMCDHRGNRKYKYHNLT